MIRSLFSDENFEDTSISAPRPNNPGPPPASQKDDQVKGISSVKVKTLKRGISEGADKVIDAIQIGASDAIKRGYLHQLMFAIYLDPDQPTNLVECYCFTFSYQVDSNGDRVRFQIFLA